MLETISTAVSLHIENWGCVGYEESTERQLQLVDQIADGSAPETLVFCTHPPVVTVGRATHTEDLEDWAGELVETSRGGRATYHGPSQLVIYPLIDLRKDHSGFPARDIHAYLRALEAVTVDALQELGLTDAEARTTQSGGISLTGVWTGAKKIASIGIAVRKWITYHGIAVNLTHDPKAFQGIRPCGFAANIMTSLEAELGSAVERGKAIQSFTDVFRPRLQPR